MPTLLERAKRGFNAFVNNKDPSYNDIGYASSHRPDRPRFTRGNEKSIVTSMYNRIAMDVASVDIRHVRTDINGQFVETVNSGLNTCLTLSANTDQTGRDLIQDIVISMFDEGCIAVVPTDIDRKTAESYDVLTMRTGSITQWYPEHVRVRVYNEKTGRKEEITLLKSKVAILENPLYSVMNEPNSTLKRLIRKLALLDNIDEQRGANRLDLIIQLPYIIKSEARKQQAEARIKDIEMQLASSNYGVAYTDGTERITQLNRPVENQLLAQVEYLTNLLYSQLGFTPEIMNGTANEQAMLNYNTRIIEIILEKICDEFKRKFLTSTAITQGQSIEYFRDPFKLVPISNIADIADKFTRNEILSGNEVRGIIGFKPSTQQGADELRNKNMPMPDQPERIQNEMNYDQVDADMDEIDSKIDELERMI